MSEIDDRTIQSTLNKGVATPIDFTKLLTSKNISLEDMAINDYRTYAIRAYVEYTLKESKINFLYLFVYIILEVRHMKIYQQEINDGIADLVKSQASIAYCTTASVASKASEQDAVEIEKIIAGKSNPDQIDWYYLESGLVSTGWNKNDDVFIPESTWGARRTPDDKQ